MDWKRDEEQVIHFQEDNVKEKHNLIAHIDTLDLALQLQCKVIQVRPLIALGHELKVKELLFLIAILHRCGLLFKDMSQLDIEGVSVEFEHHVLDPSCLHSVLR